MMVDGHRQGRWAEWGEDGTRMEGSYSEGVRSGSWARYAANGTKLSEGPYRAGVRHGRWIYYSAADARAVASVEYRRGERFRSRSLAGR